MARISISCPRCQTTYQVDPELKGRRMRCPNDLCRHIFEVPGDSVSQEPTPPAAAPLADESANSGAVGTMVPILSAEIAEAQVPAPAPPPVQQPAFEMPAPPVRKRKKPVEIIPEFAGLDDDAVGADAASGAREMTLGDWQAPPVRSKEATADTTIATPEPTTTSLPVEPEVVHVKARRRSRWLIAMFALLLVGGAGIAAWMVVNRQADIETELLARADTLFRDGDFSEAASIYRKLMQEYPASEKLTEYQFHAELSSVLDSVYAAHEGANQTVATLQRFGQFLQFNNGAAPFKRHQEELGRAARTLTNRLLDAAELKKDAELLTFAKNAWEAASSLQDPQALSPKDKETVAERFTKLEELLAADQHRADIIAQLQKLPASARSIQAARALIKNEKLENAKEATTLLDELMTRHLQRITYTATPGVPTAAGSNDDALPSMVFAPVVPVPPALASPVRIDKEETVLTLARGVLYAVDVRDGRVRWARRIGADAHVPVRVPATPISKETALFISEQNVLTCIDLDSGADVWVQRLDSPCVAEPLLIGQTAFVPTLSGRIEEIDVIAGRRHGYYQTDQRLTMSGVRQPDTDLAFFCGDEQCIYILDTAKRTCATILYTGHASGALKVPPLIVASSDPKKDATKGLLFLTQADALDAGKLRVFELPITNPQQRSLQPEKSTQGLCWFPAWTDGETLAQITDAGVFSAHGIRQPGNNDPPIFTQFEHTLTGVSGQHRGRALVVHADVENYWVLAQGRLQRLHKKFLAKTGPALGERWPESLALGDPVHAAHVQRAADRTTLFVATQPENSAHVLLSAVDAAAGRLHWQRRLGLVAHGEPLLIGSKIIIPEDDAINVLDVDSAASDPTISFVEPGKRIVFPAGSVHILKATTAGNVHVLHVAKKSLALHAFDKEGDIQPARQLSLSAELAGALALDNGYLVAPLANGILERVSLSKDERGYGPNWRSADADADSRGFAIALGKDEFLIGDGDRGLRLIHWPEPKTWDKKADTELATALVAVPAILPAIAKQGQRFVTGEVSGKIRLLDASTLQEVRSWQMTGKITSGPFVRGDAFGCVLDGNRLAWFNAGADEPIEYTFIGDIVGQPHRAGDLVMVGTSAGQLEAFDIKTGQRRGEGYLLRANVAPATTPIALSDERLLVVLSDGSAVIVGVHALAGLEKTR